MARHGGDERGYVWWGADTRGGGGRDASEGARDTWKGGETRGGEASMKGGGDGV